MTKELNIIFTWVTKFWVYHKFMNACRWEWASWLFTNGKLACFWFCGKPKGGCNLTAWVLKSYKVSQTAWPSSFTECKFWWGKELLVNIIFTILDRMFKTQASLWYKFKHELIFGKLQITMLIFLSCLSRQVLFRIVDVTFVLKKQSHKATLIAFVKGVLVKGVMVSDTK